MPTTKQYIDRPTHLNRGESPAPKPSRPAMQPWTPMKHCPQCDGTIDPRCVRTTPVGLGHTGHPLRRVEAFCGFCTVGFSVVYELRSSNDWTLLDGVRVLRGDAVRNLRASLNRKIPFAATRTNEELRSAIAESRHTTRAMKLLFPHCNVQAFVRGRQKGHTRSNAIRQGFSDPAKRPLTLTPAEVATVLGDNQQAKPLERAMLNLDRIAAATAGPVRELAISTRAILQRFADPFDTGKDYDASDKAHGKHSVGCKK